MLDCECVIKLRQSSTDTLVQRARDGDADAFGALMERHYPVVRRTAFHFLRNFEDMEDIVQEVSLCVFLKLHTFEGTAAFSTWLTRIAINASLQRLRRASRKRMTSLEDLSEKERVSLVPLEDAAPSPEQQCVISDIRRLIDHEICQLPLALQEVARDHLQDDLPLLEIARRRGLSLAAAKSRAHRGRKHLIQAIAPQRSKSLRSARVAHKC